MYSTKEFLNLTLKETKPVQVTVLWQCYYDMGNVMFDLSQIHFTNICLYIAPDYAILFS